MVHIRTGINDRHAAACAGVTGGPGCAGADHLIRGRHVGVGGFLLIQNAGQILVFDQDRFHAGNLFNLSDLSVFNVCRNDICRQGHVPDDIEL